MARVISQWARQEYGSPSDMCAAGKRVYDLVLQLEEKGKTPEEIVSFFERKNRVAIQEFVTGMLEAYDDDYGGREDHITDLEATLDGTAGNYIDTSLHSPEFKAAIKAEIKRLRKLRDEFDHKYDGTPVFTKKRNGRVEVTFRKTRKRR